MPETKSHAAAAQKPAGGTSWLADGRALVLLLAVLNVVFHILISGRYGAIPDELYYPDAGRHLAWGYVDFPPLIAFLGWLLEHSIGVSLYALRLLPAIASGVLVWVTGCLAHELGGRRFAQALAALAVMAAPVYMLVHHWFTMNAFEPILWMGCAWCVVRAINRDDPHYWVWFGLLAGIGLENKYSVLFFVLGILVGLIATKQRKFFRSPWFWLGVAVALLVFLPNFLWEAQRHFPFLENEREVRLSWGPSKHGYLGFMIVQVLITNPVVALLWMSGLVWLFVAKQGRYRTLGWTMVVVIAVLMAMHGKDYYVTPVYPMAIAAGAVGLEGWTQSRRRWLRPLYAVVILLTGMLLAPVVVPVLSRQAYPEYAQALGHLLPKRMWQRPNKNAIPGYLAEEVGWDQLARQVAEVYNALPPEQRKVTAIYATYYREAVAIDYYGAQYELPKAISGHESFWDWGPGGYDGKSMIIVGSDLATEQPNFASVKQVGRVDLPSPLEHYQILLCEGGKVDLQQRWPGLRNWFQGKPLQPQQKLQ